MTLEQAKRVTRGMELLHHTLKNVDGTPQKFRITGKVKTWKKDKHRIKIPLKRGLYQNAEATNGTIEGNRETYHIREFVIAG